MVLGLFVVFCYYKYIWKIVLLIKRRYFIFQSLDIIQRENKDRRVKIKNQKEIYED